MGSGATLDQNPQPKVVEVGIPEPTALEQLDLVVHPFGKAIAPAIVKVVQNVVAPVSQSSDKTLEGLQSRRPFYRACRPRFPKTRQVSFLPPPQNQRKREERKTRDSRCRCPGECDGLNIKPGWRFGRRGHWAEKHARRQCDGRAGTRRERQSRCCGPGQSGSRSNHGTRGRCGSQHRQIGSIARDDRHSSARLADNADHMNQLTTRERW